MVIRNQACIFRSEEQQHAFNFPYQLGTGSRDFPASAQLYSLKLEHGDLVVLATDGIWDNLCDEEVVEIVNHYTAGVETVII